MPRDKPVIPINRQSALPHKMCIRWPWRAHLWNIYNSVCFNAKVHYTNIYYVHFRCFKTLEYTKLLSLHLLYLMDVNPSCCKGITIWRQIIFLITNISYDTLIVDNTQLTFEYQENKLLQSTVKIYGHRTVFMMLIKLLAQIVHQP